MQDTRSKDAGSATARAPIVIGFGAGPYRLPGEMSRLQWGRVVWVVPALAVTYAVLRPPATSPQLLPAALVFTLTGVWVVWIDLDVHRIPTPLVGVAAPAVAAAAWAGAGILREPSRIWTSLAAAAALMAFYFLLAWFGNLGLGDVRLAGVVGLLLGVHGWGAVWRGTFAAVVVGGVTGVVLLAAGRPRNADMAFGPAIVIGALLAVVVG